MNTFLPYSDFRRSASVLDGKRLRNQAYECYKIIQSIWGLAGWQHHPAVRMWERHQEALNLYAIAIVEEIADRGWDSAYSESFIAYVDPPMPSWLGNEAFHLSHQSNLLRKDPVHYGKLQWKVPPDLPYIWPTKLGLY